MKSSSAAFVLGMMVATVISAACTESASGRSLSEKELQTLRGGYKKCRNVTSYDCGNRQLCPAAGQCEGLEEALVGAPGGSWFQCIYWFWESSCDLGVTEDCKTSRPCVLVDNICQADPNAQPVSAETAAPTCAVVAPPRPAHT